MIFELDVASRVEFNPWPHSPTAMVLARLRENSMVLDVGCASGYMAREARKKGCRTWGIEIDERAAQEARKHCEEVVVADVSTIGTLPFERLRFDAILMLDVLEHLPRPDLVLPRFLHALKPSGVIWISLPNIARFEHRVRLLFGHFDYQESGILSRGHLRFFTRNTARTMVCESGLKIESELGTGLASIFGTYGCSMMQTITAYQFLFECSAAA